MKNNFLLNPFNRIAGAQSLIWGIIVIFAGSLIGYTSKTHFDGVLNVHSGNPAPLWIHIVEPIINWLFISFWFFLGAIIFSKSKVRAIDIFGTQAFAFLPLFPTSFSGYFEVLESFSTSLSTVSPTNLQQNSIPMSDLIGVITIGVFIMFFVIWSGIWMYNGFKISSNLKPSKIIPIYVSGLILGMIIPKYILNLLM